MLQKNQPQNQLPHRQEFQTSHSPLLVIPLNRVAYLSRFLGSGVSLVCFSPLLVCQEVCLTSGYLHLALSMSSPHCREATLVVCTGEEYTLVSPLQGYGLPMVSPLVHGLQSSTLVFFLLLQ